jgi:nucleotide-binding universal stress UspA family protein
MSGVVLAVIESPQAAARTLAAAARVARLMGDSRIEVLAIRTPPEATILPSEEVLTRKRELEIRAGEQERVAALKAVFEAWAESAQQAGTHAEWCDVEGLSDAVVEEWGRRSDIVVLKRPERQDHVPERQAIHAALFDTDRPVVMVPPERPPAMFGRQVAIAWREDRFTVKAVLAALRLFTEVQHVHVLAGVREGSPLPGIPEILREHGISAELHVLPIGSRVFGQALLEKAHKLGADMLVLGAYVHHPARGLLLGGVTRYMLGHADLPVLMRH